jgi:hypothetical protein
MNTDRVQSPLAVLMDSGLRRNDGIYRAINQTSAMLPTTIRYQANGAKP